MICRLLIGNFMSVIKKFHINLLIKLQKHFSIRNTYAIQLLVQQYLFKSNFNVKSICFRNDFALPRCLLLLTRPLWKRTLPGLINILGNIRQSENVLSTLQSPKGVERQWQPGKHKISFIKVLTQTHRRNTDRLPLESDDASWKCPRLRRAYVTEV